MVIIKLIVYVALFVLEKIENLNILWKIIIHFKGIISYVAIFISLKRAHAR